MFKKILFSIFSLAILSVFIGTALFLYSKSIEKPVIYETSQAFYTDIIRKTVATGKILPRKEIDIKPQVSGVIDQLFVEAGQTLEKGDLIARIQLIPNMEHLNNAESELEKAYINLSNTELEYDRQLSLYKKNLIGEIEFKRFALSRDLQKEAVRAAENNVALIKEGASKNSNQVANLVHSTVSGMILDVPVEEGSFVIESNTFNEGTTIASIADMSDLIFEGQLDESEVGKVHEGMLLTLDIGAIENTQFKAKLEYISPKGLDEQGTIKFEIRAAVDLIENQFLRAGYSANADIILNQRMHVLAINEGNLIIEEGQTYVDIERGEQEFEKQKIEVGISDGINIEVLSGINELSRFKKLVQ